MFGSLPGRALRWRLNPLTALAHWPIERPVVMLHSGRLDRRWSRYSMLAEPDGAFRVTSPGRGSSSPRARTTWTPTADSHCPLDSLSWTEEPFDDLRQMLDHDPSLWVGYFSYDLNRFIEPRLNDPPPPGHTAAKDDRPWPLIELSRCPAYLVHDALSGQWTMHGDVSREVCDALSAADAADANVRSRDGQSKDRRERQAQCPDVEAFAHGPITAQTSRADHEAAVGRAVEYIAAGDIFQVNLAQRFGCQFSGSTRGLYQALAQHSPAWYGAYLEPPAALGIDAKSDHCAPEQTHLDEPTDPHEQPNTNAPQARANSLTRRALLCTSPELFLDLDEHRMVTTRPIKGTRPAADAPATLAASTKDAAELNMIVDLMRNDLGRVCDFGSVRVTQPRTIESHPTIHHGVATVTGNLHEHRDLIDLLKATLPGGSITGAPKVRAMQIIDELEPVRRGPYSGAIGVVQGSTPDRPATARLNIAIRTMTAQTGADDRGQVDYAVGGGIVADSIPSAEYQETLDKATALRAALEAGEVLVEPA